MRSRRHRYRKHRRDPIWKLVLAIILIGMVLIVFIGGFIWYLTEKNKPKLDKDTYCLETGPTAMMVVIIDTSDSLNLIQRTDLMNEMEKLIDTVPRNGLLEIYAVRTLQEQQVPPQPVFSRCNPGELKEISQWTDNPKLVERRWREGFREPLNSVLEQMLVPNPADYSPIMESIQWVAINSLTVLGRSPITKDLIIVSDFLHNTTEFSHYQGNVDFDSFKNSSYFRKVKAPMDNVRVDLMIVRRETRSGIQSTALLQFWNDYFEYQGVERLRFVKLAG